MNRHREAAGEYLKAVEHFRQGNAAVSARVDLPTFLNTSQLSDKVTWHSSGRLAILRSVINGRYTFEFLEVRYYKDFGLVPPSYVALYNELAWLHATCPYPDVRDPAQAVELAKKAVGASPTKEHWNTLGVAHYRAGHYSDAVTALEKSTQLGNDHGAQVWFFLAMARWQLGDKAEARAWYDKAVAWTGNNRGAVEQDGGVNKAFNSNIKTSGGQDNGVNDELRRFRVEAAALLGIEDPLLQDKEKAPTLIP
jgi:tetratricopeptide (TPR) repeat protein